MSVPKFVIGEWYQFTGIDSEDGVIRKCVDVNESGLGRLQGVGLCNPHCCERVVVKPKPRRTITLKRAIAWLGTTSFALNNVRPVEGEPRWEVWSFGTKKTVGIGATALKAIIDARRVLKVKP